VYIHTSPWRVEIRAGGAEGVSRVDEVEDEQAAVELAGRWMGDSADWRELTIH
jgi:hypothetical protein